MKRLALTVNGDMTYCTASEENIGKGRCNHVLHQIDGETAEAFVKRAESVEFHRLSDDMSLNTGKAPSVIGGTQKKWWDEQSQWMYKQDLVDPSRGLVQWNGLAEDLVSKVLRYAGIDVAEYHSCYINGKPGCKTRNFLKSDEELVELSEILSDKEMDRLTNIEDEDLDSKMGYLVELLLEKTGNDFRDDLMKLIRVDLVLQSADRHYGNIGLVYHSKTQQYRISPIYDNGQCLLAETTYTNVLAYGDEKLDLPGLNMFGMFPTSDYVNFVNRNSRESNEVKVDPEALEQFIEAYENPYYAKNKVEKVKWLLWDNIDYYSEMGVLSCY